MWQLMIIVIGSYSFIVVFIDCKTQCDLWYSYITIFNQLTYILLRKQRLELSILPSWYCECQNHILLITMSQHARYQNPETKVAKWNSTCAFLLWYFKMSSMNKAYSPVNGKNIHTNRLSPNTMIKVNLNTASLQNWGQHDLRQITGKSCWTQYSTVATKYNIQHTHTHMNSNICS